MLSLVWSASGQAFLAFSDDADLRGQGPGGIRAATAEQRSVIGGPDPVGMLCQQGARARVCAIVRDTLLAGISAIAAPIYDARGHVCAVLTRARATVLIRARGKVCPQREPGAISAAMGHAALPEAGVPSAT